MKAIFFTTMAVIFFACCGAWLALWFIGIPWYRAVFGIAGSAALATLAMQEARA